MTDEELRECFENLTLSAADFSHREHLRIAWLYLREYPLLQVLEIFPRNLKRFALAVGAQGLYHETITWAFLMIMSERMAPTDRTFEEFLAQNPELVEKEFLHRYYRPESLASGGAKSRFTFPAPAFVADATLG